MPNLKEHCEHTFKRYGVTGEDIHRFLDEPVRLQGMGHREFRHDTKTVKLVGQMQRFEAEQGRELAENIALDHIIADHEEEIRSRRQQHTHNASQNIGGYTTRAHVSSPFVEEKLRQAKTAAREYMAKESAARDRAIISAYKRTHGPNQEPPYQPYQEKEKIKKATK